MPDGELQLERVGKGRRSGGVAESSTHKLVLEQHAGASNCFVSLGLITEAIFLIITVGSFITRAAIIGTWSTFHVGKFKDE